MRFRTRLLLIFTVAIVACGRRGGSAGVGQHAPGLRAFRSAARRRPGAAVPQRIRPAAARDGAHGERDRRIRSDAPNRDPAGHREYYDYAAPLAATHDLDLLELVAADGTIVSSAQWPARFGYKEEWLTSGEDWKQRGAFLRREELPQGVTLALVAVGTAAEGDRKLYVVGGRELDREFLSTLVLPAGMRVLLYRNLEARFTPAELIDAAGPAARCRGIASVDRTGAVGAARDFPHRRPGAAAESFHAVPLPGLDDSALGVLLIASSRRELVELENSLLWTGVDCGVRGDSDRHPVELVGDGAGDAPGAAPGGKRADGWRRAIGTPPWRSPPPTRSALWRARSIA